MKRENVKCIRCGCRRFWLNKQTVQMIDFSREGAIEGHPFIEGGPLESGKDYLVCAECNCVVDQALEPKMKELIL